MSGEGWMKTNIKGCHVQTKQRKDTKVQKSSALFGSSQASPDMV